MERALEPDPGWEGIVADLSMAEGWGLSLTDLRRYSQSLRTYLPAGASAAEVRRTCIYYHQDHQLLAALRDQAHPLYNHTWLEWTKKAILTLHKAGLAQIGDQAIAAEDLAQTALVELARSLHRFRFQSRLATWAHTVIVQTARRILRDSRAQKRPQQCASLEQLPTFDVPIPDADQPEAEADAQALRALVRAVLAGSGDQRLAYIFFLHAVDDRSTEEIGGLVHLHPSRVRALLAQARKLLQGHPSLQSWLAGVDTSFTR